MAQRNEKVYDRVRQELSKNPNLGSKELYEVAQGVDKAIAQDSLQQFHARYVLPVKREKGGSGRKPQKQGQGAGRKPAQRGRRAKRTGSGSTATAGAPAADAGAATQDSAPSAPRARERRPRQPGGRQTSTGSNRDQVRALLLQFAQELTDAESRSSLVKVLGKVDSYVDRIAPAQS